nr:hypothetical protein [Tanacetum cinerariifolium]
MIQVKEMMQDKDLKNSKSKDEGSRSRSQRMNDQSHYKQAKTKTNEKTRQPPTRMLSIVQECQYKRSSPQQRRSLLKETSTLGEICMRTRNSFFTNNSSVTIPRRRNKRRTPNVVEPELCTIVEVAPIVDNRTMKELLKAPMERDVPHYVIKLMRFSYSLQGATRVWPPTSRLKSLDLLKNLRRHFERHGNDLGKCLEIVPTTDLRS